MTNKVPAIIVIIVIACGLILIIIKKNSSDTDSYKSVSDEYLIVDTNNDAITSWYLNGAEKLKVFENDYNAWQDDKPNVDSNVKISEPMNRMIEKRSTVIAVLDSDIDVYDTLDNSKIWKNDGEIKNDNLDNDKNGFIDDYCGWNFCDNNNMIFDKKNHGIHGTYISSLLIGKDEEKNFEGLIYDYNIKVMCLKVLSGVAERGNVNSLVKGIQYAEKMGAQICCLSLASPVEYENLKSTIEKSNMLFVVAAGNNGFKLGGPNFIYPACYKYDNIITVADLRSDGKLSYSSNYGKEYVDIAAPGSDIVGMIPDNKFIYLSGTSSATAIVAGAAAIVRNMSSGCMRPYEIKKALLDNAKVTDNLNGYVYTNGYLDITKSIN